MKVYEILVEKDSNLFNYKDLDTFMAISVNEYENIKNLDFEYVKLENGRDKDFTVVCNTTILAIRSTLVNEIKKWDLENIIKINNNYSIVIPRLIDALDIGNSKLEKFRKSNRIRTIKKYVFQEDKIRDAYLLKLNCLDCSPVYATQNFVDFVNENKLTGITFNLIYEGVQKS